MANNDSLNHLNVTIDVGRVKNKNANPFAEKAVRELEEELIRPDPSGRPVSADGLAPPLPVLTPASLSFPVVDSTQSVHPRTVAVV